MALQDLLGALRAQAAARRSEELARARAEADRIRASAQATRERRRRDFVAQTRQDEEAVARRVIARARAESTEGVLAARDRLLQRVRAALEERIAGIDGDPHYRRTVVEELRHALERLPKGAVVVRTRATLAPSLRDAVADEARVTVETPPDVGHGFVAGVPIEGVEIDATLEAKLAHVWPRLAVATLAEVAS
jgi:vacuolar-type H+-ATPase subunit E/Vma4